MQDESLNYSSILESLLMCVSLIKKHSFDNQIFQLIT